MDLLTQLQDKLDYLFLVFGTCIGVLQRDAPPSPFDQQSVVNNQEHQERVVKWNEQTKDMAMQVIETSKLIESIIDSLPGFNCTEPEQYQRLKALNAETIETSQQLEQTKKEAELMLKLVKDAIRMLSNESQKI
ncbi:hypothetical protein SAMD00019534_093300 [Acytostelium subglobosum LB1]|uniref:hypothetical protein n=1 Tax=Acytostelium subglobosum LB1 TaxID=1410327 RepID=UPI000644A2BF|nr:hypothetical protein SAMD00019534_093300 [Acytostelium subglobosum LB1]GAM26155.1 hypothetical protein SAMD00019534_093300 [Acytostelium subglobosum LB1]|eukprot:XP_012750709.1 hypothetical protein SAMD00019534_093300 [Acytostelium subglobosum LB1]